MRTLAELLKRGQPASEIMEQLGRAEADFAQVGRNEPCPCGSGLKFKRCHGA